MTPLVNDLWPGSGLATLEVDPQGALQPTPAYWRHWLQRRELSLARAS